MLISLVFRRGSFVGEIRHKQRINYVKKIRTRMTTISSTEPYNDKSFELQHKEILDLPARHLPLRQQKQAFE